MHCTVFNVSLQMVDSSWQYLGESLVVGSSNAPRLSLLQWRLGMDIVDYEVMTGSIST